jgi:uncharacterized glyoxalase superfamily protein PhnB
MATWTDLFTQAAAFASSVGDRLISISHSEDQQDGVIAVWYWADRGGASGSSRVREATPVFLVGDIAKTMEWYTSKLGFDAEAIPPRPPHNFCIMRKDDISIFLQQLDGYRHRDHYHEREGGVWAAYLRTQDVEALYKKLKDVSGVRIVQPLRRQDYGQWEFEVRDPDGHVLVFAEPG